ncbi:MAG TPA: hypothetical protein VGV35_04220 [Bryobacteraceae bacterium]|nr:hypothetical protein [Bryobacteraceae bacterium]
MGRYLLWIVTAGLVFAPLRADDQLSPAEVKVGKVSLTVTFGPGKFDLPQAQILAWVSNAAHSVAEYFGHFPVPHAHLLIRPSAGRAGVFNGVTYGTRGGFTRISVGEHTTQQQLDNDWMMTHELTHLAFPDIEGDEREHHWIEEGMATYVEPIARCQIGLLAPERVWREMAEYMPEGLPRPGDKRGLDNNQSWGMTYWGGALYWLLADVGIREATNNRKGLQDAMRAILNSGGDILEEWPIANVLKAGDKATGHTVLADLYKKMKDVPVQTDLNDLWRRLGIAVVDGKVKFDDNAPLANIRKSITAAR